MKNFTYLLFLTIALISCNSTGGPAISSGDADLSGYETETINGVTYASKVESTGIKVSEGALMNGNKNGAWISYYPNDGKIKKIENYINGKLNGPTLEFSNRGAIDTRTSYKNGVKHGLSGTYKFGRAVKETQFANGKIDGVHKEYFNNGKLQKEVHFKNDKQHGTFRQYNEEGEIIIQYEYKNGEKISGGVVE